MRRHVRGLLRVLTLTCREAARLVSDACDRDLTRGEGAALGLHLIACGSCRRYRAQIGRLGAAIDRLAGPGGTDEGPETAVVGGLPPDVRERIVQALARATGPGASGPPGPGD